MAEKMRWGILATGGIAKTFAKALAVLPDAELVAVGSRTQEKADKFGDEFHVAHRHGSYEALARDPDVEVVYVAPPHPMHHDNVIMCLQAGKHVLCEKPFAINASEAEEMIECAGQHKRFLMEAMWTRFLPATVKVRELLASGVLGELRMLKADLAFRAGWNPQGRLLNPELGGGALLDVGIYTVSWASMVYGRQPEQIASLSTIGETGVDEQNGLVFGYDKGELAVLISAVRTGLPHESLIVGTEGHLRVHHPFWHASKLTLTLPGKDPQVMDVPYEHNGYQCEAVEAMRCIRDGRMESDVISLNETLSVLKTLDRVRRQWGLAYPSEDKERKR